MAKLSDEECTFLCGDGEIDALGRRLLAEHPNLKLLFVTCGAGGSYAFCGSRMAFVPGFSVKIADTTGAGDAFVGAVLYQILRRGGLREAYSPAELEQLLTFGNAVGALSVQRYGAIPAIPTLAETESFLHAQGLLGA